MVWLSGDRSNTYAGVPVGVSCEDGGKNADILVNNTLRRMIRSIAMSMLTFSATSVVHYGEGNVVSLTDADRVKWIVLPNFSDVTLNVALNRT